jgi:peptide/nickel transport system substrate-binding protein
MESREHRNTRGGSAFRRSKLGRNKSHMVSTMMASVLASAAILSACSSSSSSTKTVKGGVVTMAASLNSPPNAIFPLTTAANATETNINQFEFLLYRPLYWLGSPKSVGINYAASLANKPVVAADGSNSMVTITLKPHKWSNGQAVTSRDVEFWINLLKANKANWWDYTPGKFPDNILQASYPNATTVKLLMKGTYSPSWLINELSQIVPIPQSVWDRTSATGAVGNYDETTAGAKAVYNFLASQSSTLTTYATNKLWRVVDGPFKLSAYNATTNQATFVPNKSWSGSPKPSISELQLVTYSSNTAEFDALQSGDLTYGFIPTDDIPEKSRVASEGYTVTPWVQWNIGFLQVNYTDPVEGPVLSQLYVRQALQHLIDQKALIAHTMGGYGYPTNGIIPVTPASASLSPQEKAGYYHYSPTTAARLLSSHGWVKGTNGILTCQHPGTSATECGANIPKGRVLDLKYAYESGVSDLQEQALATQSSFAKVGVGVTLVPKSLDALYGIDTACTATSACPWDLLLFPGGWGYEPTYQVPTGSALIATGGADNAGGYSSRRVDKYLTQIDEGIGGQKTVYAYENYVAQQLPMLWMPEIVDQISAVKKNLTGWSPQQAELNITPQDWKFTG